MDASRVICIIATHQNFRWSRARSCELFSFYYIILWLLPQKDFQDLSSLLNILTQVLNEGNWNDPQMIKTYKKSIHRIAQRQAANISFRFKDHFLYIYLYDYDVGNASRRNDERETSSWPQGSLPTLMEPLFFYDCWPKASSFYCSTENNLEFQ